MLRFIFLILTAILLISVIRSVAGVLLKLVAGFLKSPPAVHRPDSVPAVGELRKDPVCGIYVSTATTLKKTLKGETFYFCSPECRDKFA